MDFLGDILGAGANIASGGLLGLIGSVIGVGAKWLQEKQRQAWKKTEHQMEMDTLRLQMEMRAAETEQELAIVSQQGAWDGLGRSLHAEAASAEYAPPWVNAVRALFRPVLTAGLVVLAYLLFRDLLTALRTEDSLLGAILTEADVKELLRYIVHSLVFAASTAVVWWFGDRAMTPSGLRKR